MSKVYSKPTQVLCISFWVLHYQWPLCLGPLIFEEHLQTQLEHSAQTPLLLSVHGVPCVVELRMYFGEEGLTPLENILFLINVKLLHYQGFTWCHRATFPPTFSSLPSQPFPFFTFPCSFLSTLKKYSSLSHAEKFSYFPLLTPCQALGSSLSISSGCWSLHQDSLPPGPRGAGW